MATKLLKYGLGVFAPDAPADLDWSALLQAAPAELNVPARTRDAILELSNPDASGLVRVRVGENAVATIVERGGEEARDLRVELDVAAGARVRYVSVAGPAPSRAKRDARLAENASLTWLDGAWNGSFHRAETLTRLEGEGANVEAHQLIIGSGARFADVRHEVRHVAPRTSSDLRARTILGGESQAIVRGLVRIEAGARGCRGRQKEETLLLSDAARITAIPDLEILNDEVECGHAATTGRLDGEKLFYLMSRGFDRAAAERALAEGFAAPFLSALGDAAIEAEALAAIEESLKR